MDITVQMEHGYRASGERPSWLLRALLCNLVATSGTTTGTSAATTIATSVAKSSAAIFQRGSGSPLPFCLTLPHRRGESARQSGAKPLAIGHFRAVAQFRIELDHLFHQESRQFALVIQPLIHLHAARLTRRRRRFHLT